MSLLLDALRKSEKRRQRATPTIHDPGEPGSAPMSSARPWLGVTLSLLAFVLMNIFILQQFQVGFGPDVDKAASADSAPSVATAGEAPGAAAPAAIPPATSPQPTVRTPVEELPAQQRIISGGPAEEPAAEPEGTALEPTQQRSGSVAAAQPSRPANPPQRPAPAREPARPAHIDYWDLPDNVRQGLPQFRISVLVYDDEPLHRFILVNGLRLTEGETLQPGLTLEEILRDGAVFSYRRYRFLVQQ